jgi:hypothetical protein
MVWTTGIAASRSEPVLLVKYACHGDFGGVMCFL